MTLPMSKISECDVLSCSYNIDNKCHTIAITVGDPSCPMCDTFFESEGKGGDMDVLGGIGACRTSDCRFNKSLECRAGDIHVGVHSGHADCKTYTPR